MTHVTSVTQDFHTLFTWLMVEFRTIKITEQLERLVPADL